MKKILAIALLAPSLVFGKSVTFTPIGEDLPEIAKGSLYLNEISPNGKKAIIKYFEKQNMNKTLYKMYSWNLSNGLVEKEYDWRSQVVLGDDFVSYRSIDPSTGQPNNSGFVYETDTEITEVTPQEVPNDFFPQNTNSQVFATNIKSNIGKTGILGEVIGPYSATGRGAFIWTKESGFINPTYDIPICNWSNCYLNLSSSDEIKKGIAGSIQGNPIYIDLENSTKRSLKIFDYESGHVSNLSSNGEYGIVNYFDRYLPNTSAIYDVDNNSSTLLQPYVEHNRAFGNKSWDVELKGITNNGQLAIGKAGPYAIIWTPNSGTKKLSDYITSEYGTDFQGWTLTAATHISSNAQYIYGEGKTANGAIRVWRLELNRICETPSW